MSRLGADITWLTGRLAVGSAPKCAGDLAALIAARFTHVISVDQADARYLYRSQPFDVLWNPTADDARPKSTEWFARNVEFGLRALERPDGRLYIHCAHGLRRGPITAYAILRAQGVSPDEAKTIVERRPLAVLVLAYRESAEQFLAGLR
ncbi:MAG: dual specificity protein phosphatase family protein [Chloroflexi bacterium]|nr:dual specificity protein phosphatase family protein [Chloroflexota bacterium]